MEVERINRTQFPAADVLRETVRCSLAENLSKAGFQLLTLEELRETADTPHLILDLGILRVTGDGGKLAGYLLASELALWQRVAPWSDPAILIQAITWRTRVFRVISDTDCLQKAISDVAEYMCSAFAVDVWSARQLPVE